jgi:hypothetical protein
MHEEDSVGDEEGSAACGARRRCGTRQRSIRERHQVHHLFYHMC